MPGRVLQKPLDIGAPDLMRAVPLTYSGTLHVKVKKLLSKNKWLSRYVVISQGCLYVYEDKNSKHTEYAYTLKQFESVKELDADGDESYCFCIKNVIPTKKAILFACDTDRNRQVWITELNEVLNEIQNCSGDSGFGSGGSVLSRGSRFEGEEYKGYEEIPDVSDSNEMPHPVQESAIKSRSVQNPHAKKSQMKGTNDSNSNNIDQLKVMAFASTMTKPSQTDEDLYMNTGNLSEAQLNEETVPTSSFCSVRAANSTVASMNAPFLSIRGSSEIAEEKEFERDGVKNGIISCSGNTSPKIVYESPVEDVDGIYENTEFFDKKEYFCDNKKQIKSNLSEKPIGTFLVCPGELTKLDLCVKVPKDEISFRIHEKKGKLSLYKDCTMEKYVFPTLDALLRYYHYYVVPSKNFQVKLRKGYNSQP